jgi:hypothetical protein
MDCERFLEISLGLNRWAEGRPPRQNENAPHCTGQNSGHSHGAVAYGRAKA